MGVNNIAKQYIAYMIGGSQIGSFNYFAIGTGSATYNSGVTTLATINSQFPATSIDLSTTQQILWQGDRNSVQMSGIILTEFGIKQSGAGLTGSMMSRSTFPALTFDGTAELQLKEIWAVY